MSEPYVDYMTKQFLSGSDPDYIDEYVVPDEEPITWGELMEAIDRMGWFIENERFSKVRQGANWILWWVVRHIKVRIMQDKGLLRPLPGAKPRKTKKPLTS